MSYRNLDIWKLAREVVIETHAMTMKLPKFEQFEGAQQILRSSKTVKSCIAEGYGRRRYKADFIKFLIYSLSSNDETIDHLEILFETGSFTDQQSYGSLHSKMEIPGRKINNFIQAVERSHNEFGTHPESSIQYQVSLIVHLHLNYKEAWQKLK